MILRDRRSEHQPRGQGLVEFALVLPVMLLLLMGVIEFGRLMVTYAGVAAASREAARYGAAAGVNEAGMEHFRDCEGIRAAARRMSVLAPIKNAEIVINYDSPETGYFSNVCPPPDGVSLGDRIIVRIEIQYEPLMPLVQIPPIPMVSETKRTILKDIYID